LINWFNLDLNLNFENKHHANKHCKNKSFCEIVELMTGRIDITKHYTNGNNCVRVKSNVSGIKIKQNDIMQLLLYASQLVLFLSPIVHLLMRQ
jgi:hypothetical protein